MRSTQCLTRAATLQNNGSWEGREESPELRSMKSLLLTLEHNNHTALVCSNNRLKFELLQSMHFSSRTQVRRSRRLYYEMQYQFLDHIKLATSFPTAENQDLVNMGHNGRWHRALWVSNLERARTTRTRQRCVGSSVMDYQYVLVLTNFDLATVLNYWPTSSPRTLCQLHTGMWTRGTVITRLRSQQLRGNRTRPMTS